MSVVMIMKVAADPAVLESWSNEGANGDKMAAIVEAAKKRGVTRHLFAGGEGEVLVIDEWPDEQSFQGFFADQGEQIGAIMQGMGVTSEPQISFYRKLNTPDAF